MDNERVSHNATRAGELAEVLKAMAHPIRLRVVAILCEREANVTELTDALEIPQSQVSQQLRILRMANLVDVTRAGGYARYRLGNERLRSLISCLEGCRGQRQIDPAGTDEAVVHGETSAGDGARLRQGYGGQADNGLQGAGAAHARRSTRGLRGA